jgi:hypothetical protein
MRLRSEQLVPWMNRLSDAWLTSPRDNYPSITGGGELLLPNPVRGACGVLLQMKATRRMEVKVTSREGAVLGSGSVCTDTWSTIPAYLPDNPGAGWNTTVKVSAEQDEGVPEGRCWLRSVTVHPLHEGRGVRIRVGEAPNDMAFINSDFYEPETGPHGPYRWMGAKAQVYLYLPDVEEGGLLRISYSDPHPASVPPAKPHLAVNGQALGDGTVETGGVWDTWSARIPAAALRPGVNRVDIATRAWVPLETVKGSRDHRALGVQLRAVELVPSPREAAQLPRP